MDTMEGGLKKFLENPGPLQIRKYTKFFLLALLLSTVSSCAPSKSSTYTNQNPQTEQKKQKKTTKKNMEFSTPKEALIHMLQGDSLRIDIYNNYIDKNTIKTATNGTIMTIEQTRPKTLLITLEHQGKKYLIKIINGKRVILPNAIENLLQGPVALHNLSILLGRMNISNTYKDPALEYNTYIHQN